MIAQFQIINKVLQNKDYSFITLNNLTAEHFYGYKAEYEFIKAHYSNYHTVPDRLTFLQHFPEFVIQDVNEPDNYLIEQLYNDYNQSYLATRLNNLKKLLEADDTAGAMKYFQDSLEKLHIGSALQCTDIMSDTSRYDRYLDMIANQSKYFITTGFPELDKIITGIDRRNENMVIAARTGVGKSWLLLTIAAAVAKQGLTVGIYSGEMSVDKVAYRIDTLLGNIDNKKIYFSIGAHPAFYCEKCGQPWLPTFFGLSKNWSSKSFGGKDSVKENRQGCLSRPNKPVFKLFRSLKTAGSLSKVFLTS